VSSSARPLGAFLVVWFGQLVSFAGSALTGFAVSLEIYRVSGSITELSIATFFSIFPTVVLSPLAGALVDRWNRRRAMLFADGGAAAGALLVWALLVAGRHGAIDLRPWHLYVPITMWSAFDAFRLPAYQAATTVLVPPEHRGRANGLIDLSQSIGQIAGPAVSAWLVTRFGVESVVEVDLATFALALASLAAVRFPEPTSVGGERRGVDTLWQEFLYGWRFLRASRGLTALTALLAAQNVVMGMVTVLVTPMVLHVGDVTALGRVLSTAGLGMLAGALAMSVWGGPRRRMHAVVTFTFISGIALFVGALPATVARIATSAALFLFCAPIVAGCTVAIWQKAVPPQMQGRVFALRRMIGSASLPIGNLVAGPLADRVFEPWLADGGALAGTIGRAVGVGPGRGLGLLFVALGGLRVATAAAAHLHPALQRVEDDTASDEPVPVAPPAPLRPR